MKTQFCVLLLASSLSVCCYAFRPAPKSTEQVVACTVDGHGPYDLKYSKCMELGSDQAHTNCVLNEKDAKVDVQISFAKNKKTAVCTAHLKVRGDDCDEARCSMGNDTPQH